MLVKGLNVKRTWGSRKKIDSLIKKEKNARVKERLQGVLWRLENINYTEIAKRLKRQIDTVREWVKKWNKSGYWGLIDKPKSGRPSIHNENEIKKIEEKFNKKISEDAVRIMLHKNKVSWKKPDKVDYRRDEKQRNLFLKSFQKKFSLPEKTMVWYLDEVFFSLDCGLSYAWMPKNFRTSIEINGARFKDCVIGTVCPAEGKTFFLQTEWMDSFVVLAFFKELSTYYPNKNHLIIADNVSYHKSQGSRNYPLPDNVGLV